MADSLNAMTAGLHEKVIGIRTEVENILESASRQNAPKDLTGELNQLHQKIGSIFKV
jgi:predicted lipoprotein